jgi:hypothetical protein
MNQLALAKKYESDYQAYLAKMGRHVHPQQIDQLNILAKNT